jgi:cell division protein FtsA
MGRKGEIVAGVDFGARFVRVLVAQRLADGAVKLLGYGSAPSQGCVIRGQIQNLGAAQAVFRKALQEAARTSGVRVQTVFCGVSAPLVNSLIRDGNLPVRGGVVDLEHLEEARQQAAASSSAAGMQSLSSVTAQEWYIDDMRVTEPLNMRADVLRARIHFAQVPMVVVNNLQKCVESQNCMVEDMVYMPIAAALGCLTPDDMRLGVAVADLGDSAVGAAVYQDGSLVGTETFKWGMSLIQNDIAAALNVPFDEAASLLVEYGLSSRLIKESLTPAPAAESDEGIVQAAIRAGGGRDDAAPVKLHNVPPGARNSVPKSELDNIIFARGRELMEKLAAAIKSRGYQGRLARGLVITGGGARIHKIEELAGALCGVNTRPGLPQGVDMPSNLNTEEHTPIIGIVRHGLEFRSAMGSGRIDQNVTGSLRFLRKFRRFLGEHFF